MVAHSLSILSPLPSTSSTASSGSLSYRRVLRSFNFSRRNPKPLSHNLSPPRALSLFRRPSPEDESNGTDQFLENNSIADFMRFKKGPSDDCELQTAVVSYRRKFPWSLLRPFLRVCLIFVASVVLFCDWSLVLIGILCLIFYLNLQVDLVSTIHIADKEYAFFLANCLFYPSFFLGDVFL